MTESVVGRALEECLPFGDNWKVEDYIPDFRISTAVLDKVRLFAEGKEIREVLYIIKESSHILKWAFEFSLNQDSNAVAIISSS